MAIVYICPPNKNATHTIRGKCYVCRNYIWLRTNRKAYDYMGIKTVCDSCNKKAKQY